MSNKSFSDNVANNATGLIVTAVIGSIFSVFFALWFLFRLGYAGWGFISLIVKILGVFGVIVFVVSIAMLLSEVSSDPENLTGAIIMILLLGGSFGIGRGVRSLRMQAGA